MLPLDDRVVERLSAAVSGRPQLVTGTQQRLYAGMGRLSEHSVVSIKNVSHAVTAEITVPAENVQGVIIAQGGSIGGWSLYVKEGDSATATTSSVSSGSSWGPTASWRRVSSRCGWSSRTTVPVWARAAP